MHVMTTDWLHAHSGCKFCQVGLSKDQNKNRMSHCLLFCRKQSLKLMVILIHFSLCRYL